MGTSIVEVTECKYFQIYDRLTGFKCTMPFRFLCCCCLCSVNTWHLERGKPEAEWVAQGLGSAAVRQARVAGGVCVWCAVSSILPMAGQHLLLLLLPSSLSSCESSSSSPFRAVCEFLPPGFQSALLRHGESTQRGRERERQSQPLDDQSQASIRGSAALLPHFQSHICTLSHMEGKGWRG